VFAIFKTHRYIGYINAFLMNASMYPMYLCVLKFLIRVIRGESTNLLYTRRELRESFVKNSRNLRALSLFNIAKDLQIFKTIDF
jgi:hypothetical protein